MGPIRRAPSPDRDRGCLYAAGMACAPALGGHLESAVRHGHACVQRGLEGGLRLAAGSVWLDRAPVYSVGSSVRDPA